jgi:hypothetical protein
MASCPGADIVWLDHLVKPLVQALAALASPSTLLLLSHQVPFPLHSSPSPLSLTSLQHNKTRSRQTDELFFSQLSKHFLIEAVCPSFSLP